MLLISVRRVFSRLGVPLATPCALAIFFLLEGAPAQAQSGIAQVQHASKDAGTTSSSSLAFNVNNTAGNWIGVAIRAGSSGETFTVTDSRGNIYRRAVQFNETVNGNTLGIFYAENIAGGANTISVSDTSSATLRFAILEYSGLATTNSLDVTTAAQGTSTSPNSGNATTTANGDLLLGAILTARTESFTTGSGYKIEETVPAEPNTKLIAEDQIQAIAGTTAAGASLATSDNWAAGLAAFKAAGAGGGGLTPSITSLTPAQGAVGAAVTITGTNFGATQGTVTFNGITATASPWSATSITVTVPAGATTGPVVVTVGGVASNGVTFTVLLPASGVIVLTQHTSVDAGRTSSASLAFTTNNTAGHWIGVGIRAGGSGQAFTITDSQGNTYHQAVQFTQTVDHDTLGIFYAENIKGGANTVSVSDTLGGTLRFAILEYAGVALANSLDVTMAAQGTSASPNSGTVTTTASGDLLFGVILTANPAAFVVGSASVIEEQVPAQPNTKLIVEDQIQPAPGTASASAVLGASDTWGAAIAAFKAASSGPPPPIAVSVSPTSVSLPTGTGVQVFRATVQGDIQQLGVTFGLSGAGCSGNACGTLTNVTSTAATYSTPASVPNPGTVTLTVTSVADVTKTALATITVTTGSLSNPVVIENQQPGASEWQLGDTFGRPYATDAVGQIKGYASAVSVNKGDTITFYVSVNPVQTYTIDVYRIGWYQGLGGRLMQHIGPLNGVQEPTCPTDALTGMIQCNWTQAYSLATQISWTSGVYLAVLKNAQGFYNYIVFTVRDDSRVAALLYQQPVTTYQAYNNYPADNLTGKSLYEVNSHGAITLAGTTRAVKVSFDRPYAKEGAGLFIWLAEINFVRWAEKSGYDVTYSTDVDTHVNGGRLLNYRGFLSLPHDEYWSKPMYDAAIAARDAGVNLGFFGANSIYWQVRFEASSSGAANRVMVCYKDATLDPITDPNLKTVKWRDAPVSRPEQVLVGVEFTDGPNNGSAPYVVTNSGNWVYAGTGFKDGDSVPGIVGYEADRVVSGDPPPIAVGGTYTLLSHSPYTGSNGADYSNSSIYQAPSGAWVFASGTMAWGWALDNFYPEGSVSTVDVRIQRATANVLNRLIGQ